MLISCKTWFLDTELSQIYESLMDLVDQKEIGRLVINNSFGRTLGIPPPVLDEDPIQIVTCSVADMIPNPVRRIRFGE